MARYGLTAIGLDAGSASMLSAQIMRQLRMVARSPAHVTHENNHDLLRRLGVDHPLAQLAKHCHARVRDCFANVGHLQPASVQEWWSLVASNLSGLANDTQESFSLREVTQVVTKQWECKECGQSFPTFHALQVHHGKTHAVNRKETNPTMKNLRHDSFRVHSTGGLPQCRHCGRRFHGWPQFMGHVSQQACPGLKLHAATDHHIHPTHTQSVDIPTDISHGQTVQSEAPAVNLPAYGESAPGEFAAPPVQISEQLPLFAHPRIQQLAQKGQPKPLAKLICSIGYLNHCPECFQWVANPSYVARHANKMHQSVRQHQQAVRSWVQAKTSVQNPCSWCGKWFDSRPSAHLLACPVLWACGHLLARHSSLADQGQKRLTDVCSSGHQAVGGGRGGASRLRGFHGHEAGSTSGSFLPAVDGHSLNGECSRSPGGKRGHGSGPEQGEAATGSDGFPSTHQVEEGRQQGGQQGGGRKQQREGQQPGNPNRSSGTFRSEPGSGHTQEAGSGTAQSADGCLEPAGMAAQLLAGPSRALSGGRSGQTSRNYSLPGQALSEDGRLLSSDAPGSGLRAVFADTVQRQQVGRDGGFVFGRSRLEREEIQSAAEADTAASKRLDLLPAHLPSQPGPSPWDGQGATGNGAEEGTGGGQLLPLPPVGCRGQKARGIYDRADDTYGSAGARASHDEAGNVSIGDRQIPCIETTVGTSRVGGSAFYHDGADPLSGSEPDVSLHGSPLPLQLLAPSRVHYSTVETGEITPSSPNRQDAPIAVSLSLNHVPYVALINRSNHCYAHAVLMCIAWACATIPEGVPLWRRDFAKFLQWLFRKAHHINIWSLRPWIALTSGWQDPHSQHDAAEFLQFFETAFRPDSQPSQWQARTLPSDSFRAEVADQGHLWPLTLPAILEPVALSQGSQSAATRPVTLQGLVIMWRNQAQVHALVTQPTVVPLQLNRFNDLGHKILHKVSLSPSVYLPVFYWSGSSHHLFQI